MFRLYWFMFSDNVYYVQELKYKILVKNRKLSTSVTENTNNANASTAFGLSKVSWLIIILNHVSIIHLLH